MLLTIHHLTRYIYGAPVFLEPHELRLAPRHDPAQRVESFAFVIRPEPVGITHLLDAEGNHCLRIWFDGTHEALEVETRARVRTLRANPFNFLAAPGAMQLPPELNASEVGVLGPCLVRTRNPRAGEPDPVLDLARTVAGESDATVQDFLLVLNARIFEGVENVERLEPGIQTPAETLGLGCGACRDQAVLFVEACRAMSVPARFVSGYQEGDPDRDERDLHAWAEAWIPGGGWRGFDPTHGLAVADRHVALAASADPALVAPVMGSFRGTDVAARLEHDVRIRVED